jgi:hypothetical protein
LQHNNLTLPGRFATPSEPHVHGEIIRGLRRRLPEIDLVRAQDALPEGTPDPQVLAWAAAENRVLITNDRNTMVGFACQRVASGAPMPGLIATTNEQSIGSAIDDIIALAEYTGRKRSGTRSSCSSRSGDKRQRPE